MATELLPDELWQEIQPLLPPHRPHPKGGNDFASDRDALRGIIFVLRSGIPWRLLPTEVFHVSGVTCWRRLRDWTAAKVWSKLHGRLLEQLGLRGKVDLSAGVIDSASVRAVFGGRTPEPVQSTAPKPAASDTC